MSPSLLLDDVHVLHLKLWVCLSHSQQTDVSAAAVEQVELFIKQKHSPQRERRREVSLPAPQGESDGTDEDGAISTRTLTLCKMVQTFRRHILWRH